MAGSIQIPPGFELLSTLKLDPTLSDQDLTRGVNIHGLAWSPDGSRIASLSGASDWLTIWDVVTNELVHKLNTYDLFPRDKADDKTRVRQILNTTAWSPDGKMVASGNEDGGLVSWDLTTGFLRSYIAREGSDQRSKVRINSIGTVAWSPNGEMLAASHLNGSVSLWNAVNGELIHVLRGHEGAAFDVVWSPDGSILASSSYDHTIKLWDVKAGNVEQALHGHDDKVFGMAWSPDGKMLVSGSSDRTIRVWDTSKGRTVRVLEGHENQVLHVAFSHDGFFLASRGRESVRLWRHDTWETVAILDDPHREYSFFGVAFHPSTLTLAIISENNELIRIWSLDRSYLRKSESVTSSVHYTNAKVVLLGDSGVGKSGLGLVLSGQPFVPTDSTHGRRIWMFSSEQVRLNDKRRQIRETLLWDLAGQPGYRLIHQLHLNEVAVALVVFDGKSETNPFAGVRHWDRALRQAQCLQSDNAWPLVKFLVAARMDRGGIGVSRERIDELTHDQNFAGYFETSARDNLNIAELREAIRGVIHWDQLPEVSSTELFQDIRKFLVTEKEKNKRLLSTLDDLYHTFRRVRNRNALLKTINLRAQFDTCIGRVEAAGLIRRLSFGNLILLQPELLDAYASALVNAARDEPDGLGSITEEAAREGRFSMSADERIQDKEQEKLLLIATVEDLLRHEIVLREETAEGVQLVFPSQLTREQSEIPDPKGKTVIFRFSGPLLSIYARLVVRLSHSNLFKKKHLWKNGVSFAAKVGGICGLYLNEIEEGRGELVLFFDHLASEETRYIFEFYVQEHLERWAIPASIERVRIFVCPDFNCSTPISEEQAKRRRERGFKDILCPVCETRISLLDREERLTVPFVPKVDEIDLAADVQRKRELAVSIIQGKLETKDFDVFLAHNSIDKPQIKAIAKELEGRGLLSWVDEQDLRPGSVTQEEIERVLSSVKAVAVFVGPNGPGPWERMEVRVAMSLFVKQKLRLIPVLLPGIKGEPELPLFLNELHWVHFDKGTDDTVALDKLEFGITGTDPSRATRAFESSIASSVS